MLFGLELFGQANGNLKDLPLNPACTAQLLSIIFMKFL